MKAAVFRQSKGLVIEEIPIPDIDADQVLVKVANTGFCGSDHTILETAGTPDGIVLGHEVSGTVVGMGANVEGVSEGSRVMIRPTYCGKCPGCRMGRPQLCSDNRRSIGIGDLPGGFAEYIKVFPQMLIPIPENVDSRNAALAEAFAVGLHAIKLTGKGDGSALVVGGGSIGLTLVKTLKLHGFGPVAVSEPVRNKRDLALEFGADVVVDPLSENLGQRAFEINAGSGFETIFECSGRLEMLPASMDLVSPGGTVCQLSVLYDNVQINPATLMFKEVALMASYGNTHEDNIQCLELMSQGKLDARPLISDLATLDELPRIYRERIHPGKAIKVMLRIGEEF